MAYILYGEMPPEPFDSDFGLWPSEIYMPKYNEPVAPARVARANCLQLQSICLPPSLSLSHTSLSLSLSLCLYLCLLSPTGRIYLSPKAALLAPACWHVPAPVGPFKRGGGASCSEQERQERRESKESRRKGERVKEKASAAAVGGSPWES